MQYLTKFNDYVQQLPIEEMAMVGMAKQEQYNQGVEKIQGQIDKVAGMDIYKDADRAYLQSKLDTLGNQLNIVAAGDFSNFQLTNSTAGMVNQIGNDKRIQTAVGSTAKIRKGFSEMEKARQEGKSSPSNDWDFNIKVSKYAHNGEIGESFGHNYQPKVDVDKKMMEIFKSLHSNLTEEDILTITKYKPDGSIDSVATAKAMETRSIEGVSAEQIENALRSSLSVEDLNQLAIDGRYEFRNHDSESLSKVINNNFDKVQKTLDDKINYLTDLKKATISNPSENKKTSDALDYHLKLKDSIASEKEYQLQEALDNPDNAKYFIYKNQTILSKSNSFSWENRKLKYSTNPQLQAEYQEKDQQLRGFQFDLSVRAQKAKERQDAINNSFKSETLKLAKKTDYRNTVRFNKEMGLDKDGKPLPPPSGTGMVKDDPATILKELDADMKVKGEAKERFMATFQKIGMGSAELASEYFEDIKSGKKSSKEIPIAIRSIMEQYIKDSKEVDLNNEIIRKNDEDANKEIPYIPELAVANEKVNQAMKNVKIVSFKIRNKQYNFSANEIAQYRQKEIKYTPVEYGAHGAVTKNIVTRPILTDREKLLEIAIKTVPNIKNNVFGEAMTNFSKAYGDFNKKFQKVKDEKLAKTMATTYAPRATAINLTTPEAKKEGKLQHYLNIVEVAKIESTLNKNDKELLENVTLDPSKITGVSEKEIPGTDRKFIKLKSIVGDSPWVEITSPSNKLAIPKNVTNVSQNQTKMDAYSGKWGRTNIPNPSGNPAYDYFHSSDFLNLSKFEVTGTFQPAYIGEGKTPEESVNGAVNYPTLRLKLNHGKTVALPLSYGMGKDDMVTFINNLSDKDLYYLVETSELPADVKSEVRDKYNFNRK